MIIKRAYQYWPLTNDNKVVGTIAIGLVDVSTAVLIINYVNGEFQNVNFQAVMYCEK